MSWWAWLIIGLAVWLVVSLTLLGTYALLMARKASRVVNSAELNLGPSRRQTVRDRRPAV